MSEPHPIPNEEVRPEPEKNFIKSILAYIPFIVTIAYVMGITDLICYYYYYGFDVTSFLDFSEISMSSVSDLIYIIPIGIIVTMLGYFQGFLNRRFSKSAGDAIKRIPRRGIRLTLHFAILLAMILIGTFVTYHIITELRSNDLHQNILGVENIAGGIFLLLITIIPLTLAAIEFRFKSYRFFLLFLFTMITSLTTSIITTLMKVDEIRVNHSTFGSSIVVEDGILKKENTVTSNSSYYYIGKTSKYVFFYDSKKDKVDVYPEKNIAKYSLK